MLHSFRRLFVIYKGYRGRLLISQVLLMLSALSMIGVATLNQRLINEGIQAQNETVLVRTGIFMMVLALFGGLCMAGTAAFAVFFSQGTAYIVRTELYNKIQTFSFGNFNRFRTGHLMVRLNADVINIQNAVMYSVMLLLYAPFMVLVALIFASSWSVRSRHVAVAYRIFAHAALLAWLWRELVVLPGPSDAYVTVAWGIVGAAMFVAGLRRDHAHLIRGGVATLFLVVAKLFLWDLAGLEPIWRVLLFLGFGGLFLLLSYHLRDLWRPREDQPPTSRAPERQPHTES